jgi:hypothetical protein
MFLFHMPYEMSLLSDASSELKNQLESRVAEKGYTNLRVCFNLTKWEKEQKAILYVQVEYKNLLRETRENKLALREVIAKKFYHNGLESKVFVEFAQLPRKIKTQLNNIKKSNSPPVYL